MTNPAPVTSLARGYAAPGDETAARAARRRRALAATYRPDRRLDTLLALRASDPAAYARAVDPTTRIALGSYLAAFRGMAQLRWSRKLRERLGLEVERSDTEVAAERTEDGVLLASLYLDQWRAVWETGKVVALLDAAATGDAAAVWEVVEAAARAAPSDGTRITPPGVTHLRQSSRALPERP